MIELMIEILGYVGVAALLGFLLGWLTWGWKQSDRISAARAEGAREARTTVDGAAGLRDQLRAGAGERARLEEEIDRLTERLAAAEVAAGLRGDDAVGPAEDDAVDAAASPAPGFPEAGAPDVGPPAFGSAGSAVAFSAGDETPDRPSLAPERSARLAAARHGAPTAAVPPVGSSERQPAAATDDRPRRTNDLVARLASYGPPDVTLRKQIMSGSEPEDSAGGSEPDMPHPTAFTLRRQRVTGADEPVTDERAPREPEEEAGDSESALPRPAAGTLRQQHDPEGIDEPPVVDEQVPPPGRQTGDADMPRPPVQTLRQQRVTESSGEPPVVDEQMPPQPAAGAGAPADDSAARPEAVAPASLLADRPAEIDDLQLIRGVGKVTERLLNRNGIWLYRQVAGLTPAGTAWLSGVLDMPNSRIERERWVEQAASLHRGKYGSAKNEPGG